MTRGRLGIMMTLVPLLARLEGRRVAAFVRHNPARANVRETSTRASRAKSLGNNRISQRRRPRTSPVAALQAVAAGGGVRRESATTVRSFSADGSGAASASTPGLGMEDAREGLKTLFGHDDFRDGQVCGVHFCGNEHDMCMPCVCVCTCVLWLRKGELKKRGTRTPPYLWGLFSSGQKIMIRISQPGQTINDVAKRQRGTAVCHRRSCRPQI